VPRSGRQADGVTGIMVLIMTDDAMVSLRARQQDDRHLWDGRISTDVLRRAAIDEQRAWVAGQEVTALTRDEQLKLRRERVALVFQSFALLPMLSAAENIGVPIRLSRTDSAVRERRVSALLSLVGLEGSERKRPHELSRGEQQRVGIARAVANNGQLLLADEPTAQLGSQTARFSATTGIWRLVFASCSAKNG
jgi:predicted ABC-type transport system involved in lysophospholipase L1 biosynthesis ATPase subunit